MNCLKNYLLIFIIGLLIFQGIKCSSTFEPERNNTFSNPVVIEFDPNIDFRVKEAFEIFAAEYNINLENERSNFRFDEITSFITNASFKFNKPRLYNDTLKYEQKEILTQHLLTFVDKWKELFGVSSENIKLSGFEYSKDFDGYRIIFIQHKINQKRITCVVSQGLGFLVKLDGIIHALWSSGYFLKNDIQITNCNLEKIIDNIIGHNISGYGDNFKISKGDFFGILDSYEFYVDRKPESYYVYKLKGVVVESPESDNKYTFFCHPETGEIINVRRNY